MNPTHGSTLPPEKYLAWSRLACMLRSRRLPSSPRSAPSPKLSLLYVPVSPVSRAERCKPCPVALVSTLGRSRSLSLSLILLASALSGNIITGYVFFFKQKRSLHADTSSYPARQNKHTGPTTPTDAFAPASTSGHLRGRRAQVGLPLSAPMPTHPRRDPGRDGLGRRAPKPHTSPIHMCTAATTAVCCC